MTRRDTGFLISFEGIDCSGKSTQMSLLSDWLKTTKQTHVITREPGGTPLGYHLRKLLLTKKMSISPLAQAYLYQADRAENFEKVILPALALGRIVLTDRCIDSAYAYQFDVGEEFIRHLNGKSIQGRYPDLTFLLEIDPAIALQRVQNRTDKDFYDIMFLKKMDHKDILCQRYRQAAHQNKDRFKVINAEQPIDDIHNEIKRHVMDLIM